MFAIPRFHPSKSAVLGLSALVAIAALPATQAQITYDAQIPFSFSSPTLVSPRGIAVAPDGTVYVADVQSGTTGRVVQITPTTGTVGGTSEEAASFSSTAVVLTPSIALQMPTAVAVDSTGALYIADATGNQVIEMPNPETSSAATSITYPGTKTPTALAVDSSNNLYIADETQNAIYEVTSGVAAQLPISPATLMPVGLAVDSAGDVYFASAENNEVYEYVASTKSTVVDSVASTFEFSASNAVLPIGMGFDPAGNLYVLDSGAGHLIEITASANYLLPFSASVTPNSLAVSSIGNLYLSDAAGDTADELFYNNNPFNFGSIQAGTNSPAVTVNFYFGNAARGLATYQSMEGDITTAFQTSSSLCPGSQGTTCSMAFYVDYSSALPGTRNGAVGLTDNAGDILAAPSTGIDVAGAMALYPGTQSILSQTTQALYEPQGLAVTGNGGTLFVIDEGGLRSGNSYTYTNGAVWAYKVTAGVPGGAPTPVGSFPTPMAAALDAIGNLYIADYSGTVTVVPVSYNSTTGNTWPGYGTALNLTGAVALNHPMALVFDPAGNLYIGDMGPAGVDASVSNPGYIIKVPADGGPATRLNLTVGGVAVVFPQALATDSFGNLYIADGGDDGADPGGVDVVPVATGTASAISFGSFGQLNQPSGLGFDAANDLYVLDGYNQRVLVVPMTYTGTVPTAGTANISLLGQSQSGLSGLDTPSNLVVWPGQQSITISDIGYQTSSGTVTKPQVFTLQAVNTTIDATSGSASVTGVNVGNQEITFLAPTNTNSAGISFSGCGSSGGTTLAIGAAPVCSPTVTFTGAGGGATITLNGNTSDDYSVLGNQIIVPEPEASLSAPTLSFSPNVTATLTNNGGGPLIISNIHVTGKATLAAGGTCSTATPLPTGQSCTVNMTITSTFSTGTVTVTDNSGNVPGSTQTASTYYLIDISFDLPAVDVPRNLLDRDTSGSSITSNHSDVSDHSNQSNISNLQNNADNRSNPKKLHR